MKFIHLSDLHIGKKVNEFSMIEDQEYILKQILDIIDAQNPDGVIIAGDIYDKSVPPSEAVIIFDNFLVELSKRNLNVFVISGNHDSPERIAFGGRLMQTSKIYMSPVFNGNITPVTLNDSYGNINIWLLPFIKPAHVRKFNEDDEGKEIVTYTDAMQAVIDSLDINQEERNILVTHQFVTGSERSESEQLSVGGTDNVDVSVFNSFDYTALGHIHKPQNCGSEKVHYSGTPLKYSFSEAKDKKSVSVVEIKEKGTLTVTPVPLKPLRDMVELKGSYAELTALDYYKNTSYCDDYVHITLTDEEDIPDAIGKLRAVYKNLMKLDYDNHRTRNNNIIDNAENVEKKSPYEHFAAFYEKQNNQPMSDIQTEIIKKMVSEIWEDLV